MSRFPLPIDPWAEFQPVAVPNPAAVPTAVPMPTDDPWAEFQAVEPPRIVSNRQPVDVNNFNPADAMNRGSAFRDWATAPGRIAAQLPANIVGLFDPEYANELKQNVDLYYGTPQRSGARIYGEVLGGAAQAIAALPTGPVGMAGIYGAGGAGDVRTDIAERRAAGEQISGEQELTAAAGSGVVQGLSGYVGGRLFKSIGDKLAGTPGFRELVAKEGVRGVTNLLKRIAPQVAAEAGEEGLTTLADNLVRKYTYAPEQEATAGVMESALIGGAIAPFIGGVAGRRGRSQTETAPETPVAPAVEPPPAPTPQPDAGPTDAELEQMSEAELARRYPSLIKGETEAPSQAEIATRIKEEADTAELDRAINDPPRKRITKEEVMSYAGENVDREAFDQLLADEPYARIEVSPSDFMEIPRQNLDKTRVEKYAQMDPTTAPPAIAAATPEGKLRIADGRHRMLAAALRAKRAGDDPRQAKFTAIVPESWAKAQGRLSAGRKGVETVGIYARGYMQQAGLPATKPSEYARVDVQNARKIATAYEAAEHRPDDPAVKASYDAFKQETKDQWDYLTKQGVKMEPWTGEGQPYKNSAEMQKDVAKGHLWFFTGGDIPANHPLAEKVPGSELTYNDVFRAVHDYFGHAKEGNQFGPRGEENAWREHVQMYSPAARGAMTTETRGQNSWVNFGPKGAENRADPTKTQYAEQKATLLPEEFWSPGEVAADRPMIGDVRGFAAAEAERISEGGEPPKLEIPGRGRPAKSSGRSRYHLRGISGDMSPYGETMSASIDWEGSHPQRYAGKTGTVLVYRAEDVAHSPNAILGEAKPGANPVATFSASDNIAEKLRQFMDSPTPLPVNVAAGDEGLPPRSNVPQTAEGVPDPDRPKRLSGIWSKVVHVFGDPTEGPLGDLEKRIIQAKGSVALASMDADRLGREYAKTAKAEGVDPDADNVHRTVEAILRGKSATPEMRSWAKVTRERIDQASRRLAEKLRSVGLSGPADTVEGNLGSYLMSVPIESVSPTGKLKKWAKRQLGLSAAFGKIKRDGYIVWDRSRPIGKFATKEEAQAFLNERIEQRKSRMISKSARKRGVKESDLTKRAGQGYHITDPLSEEWRSEHEIHDPRYLAARSIIETEHNAEMIDLFSWVAEQYGETVPEGIEKDEVEAWADANDLVEMPMVGRLHNLKNTYVPREVASRLMEEVRVPGEVERLYRAALSAWKASKTIYNPGTHVRNWLTNALVFADLADASPLDPSTWSSYKNAAESMAKRDDVYKAAVKMGLIGNEYSSTELRAIRDQFVKTDNVLDSLFAVAGKTHQGLMKTYDTGDQLMKLAAVHNYVRKGVPLDQALKEVDEWYPNYARVSRATKWLRNSPVGAPFVSFFDQSMRISARAIRRKPLKVAKIVSIPIMLNAFSKAMLGIKEEEEKLVHGESAVAKFVQPVITPIVPKRDKNGRVMTLDLTSILPLANDLVPQVRNGSLRVPWLLSGPFATAAIEQWSGQESFTGRPFIREGMSVGEQMQARGEKLWGTLAPVPTLATYGGERVTKTLTGESDESTGLAVLGAVGGLNVRTPYIAERMVKTVIQNMVSEGDREAARSLLNEWNETYKPGNKERLNMADLVRGMRSSRKREKNTARDRAAEAFMRGDRRGAKTIIDEYNEERSNRITPLTEESVAKQAGTFERRGRTR